MDQGVDGEHGMGDLRSFVIARHQKHRDPLLRHTFQRKKRLLHQVRGHPAAKEQIPAVHDEIDVPRHGVVQRALKIGEEVVAAAPTRDAGPLGQVEPQVGVGKEEEAHP
jgi:hypothetical protein